jgi:hypothetical protein
MPSGRAQVPVSTGTFVELEARVRIDLFKRSLLRDVPESDTKIRLMDRFADHELIGVSLADEASQLRSGTDPWVVREKLWPKLKETDGSGRLSGGTRARVALGEFMPCQSCGFCL